MAALCSPFLSPGPRPRLPGEEPQRPRSRGSPSQHWSATLRRRRQRPASAGIARARQQQYNGPRSERFPDPNKRDDKRHEIALAEFRNSLRAASLETERRELEVQRRQQLARIARGRPVERKRERLRDEFPLYPGVRRVGVVGVGNDGGRSAAAPWPRPTVGEVVLPINRPASAPRQRKTTEKIPWWEMGYGGGFAEFTEESAAEGEDGSEERELEAQEQDENQEKNQQEAPWLSRMRRVPGSAFAREDRFGSSKRASFVLCDSVQAQAKRRFGHRSLPARLFSRTKKGAQHGHEKKKVLRGLQQRGDAERRTAEEQRHERGGLDVLRKRRTNKAPTFHGITRTRAGTEVMIARPLRDFRDTPGPTDYGRPWDRAENAFRVKAVPRALIDTRERETAASRAVVDAAMQGVQDKRRARAVEDEMALREEAEFSRRDAVSEPSHGCSSGVNLSHAFGTSLRGSRSTSDLEMVSIGVGLNWQRKHRLRPHVKILRSAPNRNLSATIAIGSTAPFP